MTSSSRREAEWRKVPPDYPERVTASAPITLGAWTGGSGLLHIIRRAT
jgi:hypothetical protein